MLGIRSGFLVGISIPGSFLMGILLIGFTGFTMNMMVLFGLILSVGMLVDGAIVVTEYADRKLAQGATRKEAYYEASSRMALPIISSTATTIAAFSPLLFWPGIVGKFMRYMPIALVCVLISSLFVALIFIPVIGAYTGKEPKKKNKNEVSEIEKEIQHIENGEYSKLKGYNKTYYNIITWALERPKKIIWSCVAIMFFSFFAFGKSQLGTIFFPDTEPNFVYLNIHALGNLSAEEERDIIRSVEKEIKGQEGIKTIYTRSGARTQNSSEDVVGYLQLELKDWKERITADEIIHNIRRDLKEFPGIEIEILKEEHGPSQGKPLQIEISSETDNFEDLKTAVKHVKKGVESIEGFIDTEDTAPLPGIQWEFEIDRAQALKYNLDISSIGQTIQLITQGARLTSYRPSDTDDEVWIVLRYPEAFRKITELDNIQIPTESGNLPISNFVKIKAKEKVGNIRRINKNTVMEVRSEVKPDYQLSKLLPEVKEWIKNNPVPVEGINIKFRGEFEDTNEAMSFLAIAFLNAVFIMGIILLTQFNNFYYVGLILSAIVLSITGVMLGLVMTLSPFTIIMTGIAIVSLAGIVVNNNIVLIDTFAEIREHISDKREAVIRTGVLRLRPVILTTITTILGLVPMALRLNIDFFSGAIIMGGPSMDMWSKFSRSVIFGLSFATILTLVFTPCMLYLGELKAERKAKKKSNKK
jgi:multidrug efflux pump